MTTHYFLNEDHTYRPCGLMEWANQFETIDRHVAHDIINEFVVSTVWMGINIHKFDPPLVFETMIFKNGQDIYCSRSPSWDDAKRIHEICLRWINEGCKGDEP